MYIRTTEVDLCRFFLRNCFAQLFSSLVFWQNFIGAKAACKMLVILTTGNALLTFIRGILKTTFLFVINVTAVMQ
jgi:hypothetical protein